MAGTHHPDHHLRMTAGERTTARKVNEYDSAAIAQSICNNRNKQHGDRVEPYDKPAGVIPACHIVRQQEDTAATPLWGSKSGV
eukprot:1188211-Prorocentrum_minimum.AAC.4